MIDQYGNFISWIPNLKTSKEPLYIALAGCIEQDIANGVIEAGFRMPPQRVLANFLNINHSTVTKAYKLCEERGLLKGAIGKGTFVSTYAGLPQSVLSDFKRTDLIDMGTIHPLDEMNALIGRYVKDIYASLDYPKILDYGPPEGFLHQRHVFSRWLEQYELSFKADQLVVTSGAQNALTVVLSALFARGDRIFVDEVTYIGITNTAKILGLTLVPVATNADGIDIECLEYTCRKNPPKGIYLIPDSHNPTTCTLSLEKRKQIAEIVIRYDLTLIEDDPYGGICYEGLPPISKFAPDSSIHIKGTSKSISPAFRIGVAAMPAHCVRQAAERLNAISWSASTINAEVLTHLILTDKYDEICKLKREILHRRNSMVDSQLHNLQLLPAKTSFIRYVMLPTELSDIELEHECLKRGLQIFAAKRFSVGINQNANAIRLSVSGPKSSEQLLEGLQILKGVIESGKSSFIM